MKPQLSQRVGWLWKSSLAMLALLIVGLIVWLTPLGAYLSLASFSVRYDLTTDARYQTYSLRNASTARAMHMANTLGQQIINRAYWYSQRPNAYSQAANLRTGTFYEGKYWFDCSGFVWRVYHDEKADYLIQGSNSIWTQQKSGVDAAIANVGAAPPTMLAPGDLVFFNSNGSLEHVGIVYSVGQTIGSTTFISPQEPGKQILNPPKSISYWMYGGEVPVSFAMFSQLTSPTGGASPVFTSGHRPVVARDANGRMEVFEVAQDTQLWHEWQTDTQGSWSGWHSMGGSWPQDPAVALDTNGYLHIFIVGNTGSNGQATLFHAQQTSPGSDTWTGWNPLAGVWPSGVPTVARNLAGGLEVFMRGLDANLYHSWQCSGCSGGWSGWYPMGGNWNTNPVAADNHNGTMSVFMVGESSELYVNQENTGGGWSGWLSLHGSWPGQPAVATNLGNGLEVFMRGQNHTLYHAWQTSPGSASWSGWNSLGGVLPRDPVVANNADGRIEVFTIGTDATLYNQWEDSFGHWSGWHSLGGNWPGQPAVALNLVNGLEVFIAGNSTTMYHAWQNGAGNSSSYTTWNHMPT